MKAITATLLTLFLLMPVGSVQAYMVSSPQKDGIFQSSMDRFGKGINSGDWKGGKESSHTPAWFSDDAGAFAEMGYGPWARGGSWNGATLGAGNAGFHDGWWNSPSSFFAVAFWQSGIADALDDFDWDGLENMDALLIIVWGVSTLADFDLESLQAVFWWPLETTPGSHVPLPGAVWLLGSGLFGLVGLRKKRRL
ncbi:VPLPA-CTERM sorting domain-containing protein [Desulfosarcina ovata]|uniref:Ice-binding protein C-terminal domain-containing protein n=1 Tax=Desulfosarcina ovata subsp. ovata TaxID=2752305 RepID=A0A5K8A9F2_9BACT|nr:VPLPA-CTERM sorting domain-containing protein [Desulfosarcina ovata]BBO89078.1 hypothetical protein DSCOOX_22580 [Desulfosarcina ovata subsp. ovata]